jgi:hypothetical protein
MARSFAELLEKMPPERRARVEARRLAIEREIPPQTFLISTRLDRRGRRTTVVSAGGQAAETDVPVVEALPSALLLEALRRAPAVGAASGARRRTPKPRH